MDQADEREGIIHDLRLFAGVGKRDELELTTLPGLAPIALAIRGGVIPYEACLTLLQEVAEEGPPSLDIRVCAAAVGALPRHEGTGFKGSPGPKERRDYIGKHLLPGRTDDQVIRAIATGTPSYARAAITYARGLSDQPERLCDFLLACHVSRRDAIQLVNEFLAQEADAPQPVWRGSTDAENRPSATPSHTLSANGLHFAGALLGALKAAYDICDRLNRKYYTADTLFALLVTRGSLTVECLNDIDRQLASELRSELVQWMGRVAASSVEPFAPFVWIERPEVVRAQEIAIEDRASVLNDLHLLLGILASAQSETNQWLAERLGSNYEGLRTATNRRRHQARPEGGTPHLPGR